MSEVRLRRLGIQLMILAAAILAVCLVYRISRGNSFIDRIPIVQDGKDPGAYKMAFEDEAMIKAQEVRPHDDYVEVHLIPLKKGTTGADLLKENGEHEKMNVYSIGPFNTILNRSTGNFTGDNIFLAAVTSFFLIAALLMFVFFLRSRGADFYSYATIYSIGFSIFALDIGLVLLGFTIRHIKDPMHNAMFIIFSDIRVIGCQFIMVTSPLILIFSLLLWISNIELLRHERRRFRNVLGILAGIVLVLGALAAWWMLGMSFSGSWKEMIIRDTIQSVYYITYVYFECMLIGAVICALKAVFHKPAPDKDFCVILGCGFRKDGTLSPLLRGRVDRAIAFAKDQEAHGGKELIFIPSGGQGKDEVMPEAQAMKRYLLEQGIGEERILAEDQSANTYDNMANSRKIIENLKKDAKVIYSTTNYHVFRSGVWASLAGLKAEGIGARTKWWFWPNAFIRECVGLLANRWKQELAGMIVLIGFFSAVSLLMLGL